MSIENPISRRGILQFTGALIASKVNAMQKPRMYGLEALLDGSGMARIPAGEFQMGSATDNEDERPVHRVRIAQPFEMSKCEVSQAQWETVMADPHAGPSAGRPTPQVAVVGSAPSHFKGVSLPVENVSWDDIQVFLKRLNARDPSLGDPAQRYRLPTEAEWEYACKAGKTDPGNLAAIAWYKPNSDAHTQPIAEKEPNTWGLYDMLGNVCEWVQDWYGADYYAQSPATNPQGPDSGSYRVYRGGCWFDVDKYCRPALRRFDFPVSRVYNVGFRVVSTLK